MNEFGVWELKIPNKPDGSSPIDHKSRIKVSKHFQWTIPVFGLIFIKT